MEDLIKMGPQVFQKRLEEKIIETLEEKVNALPPLPISRPTLSSLETIEPGTYLLEYRPEIDFINSLPKFKSGSAEIGLTCVRGKWLITISDNFEVHLPDELKPFEYRGYFSLCLHTHPSDEDTLDLLPSERDVAYTLSALDKCGYIIHENGIVEYKYSNNLPGGYSCAHAEDIEKAWGYWCHIVKKFTKEDFDRLGVENIKQEFYEEFCDYRRIPWDDEMEINRILDKENIKVG